MGNKAGARNRERLYGPKYHQKLGGRGGTNLWKKIKQGKFPVNPMGRP